MGKKKLKAVAIVKGTKALRAADPRGLVQCADDIAHDLKTDPSARSLYEYGTLPGVVNLSKLGALPIKNYTTNVPGGDITQWEAPKLRHGFDHRGHQCNACGMHHCHMSVIRDGVHKGTIVDEPEYEGWSGAGWTIGVTEDKAGVAWLNTQLDRACVDVNEFGWVCGWVMEGLEKGWLTRQQVGFDLKWGDTQGANRLLQLICKREGFGDLLAEGLKRAAEKLGGAAKAAAVYTGKGAVPRGHDHRARWEEMLDTTTSSTATMETGNPVHQTEVGLPARINPFNGEEVARLVAGCRGRRNFEDSLGICIFTTRTRLENVCRALSAATGWYYTLDEAMKFGRRTAAINRAVALRCGLTPDLEWPSERYGSTPHDGPAKGQAVSAQWESMVDTWYREVGYDRKTGKPLPKTLKDLGLDWLSKELWGAKA
jgi:aldehyde:ferredoxin oxidoreductase